ncbi:unnamed protein product [Linum trigynum]|uniref:Uncharacterized protein n=1 Tax=Linum trigynum TaxID=586398 RepID=A0AAV2GF77_9ROSI
MTKATLFPLRAFLVLSLVALSRAAIDFASMAESNFPSVQAEKFIRNRNLDPAAGAAAGRSRENPPAGGGSRYRGRRRVDGSRVRFLGG